MGTAAISAAFGYAVDAGVIGATFSDGQSKSGGGQAGDEQAGKDLLFHFGHLGEGGWNSSTGPMLLM
ncbi:hypothetical protein D3C81_1765040 [compost metagenome]